MLVSMTVELTAGIMTVELTAGIYDCGINCWLTLMTVELTAGNL